MKMPKYILMALVLFVGCTSQDKSAGKGVITETTNGTSARGWIELSQGVPAPETFVKIYRAQDIPSAWEGIVYAADTTDQDGHWSVGGIFEAQYQAIAMSADGKVMGMTYFSVLANQEEEAEVPIALNPMDTLYGEYADFSAVKDTLSEGWFLRACLRGLGYTKNLGEAGEFSFEGVPRGSHYVRIQRVDGAPSHEETLWAGWIEVE